MQVYSWAELLGGDVKLTGNQLTIGGPVVVLVGGVHDFVVHIGALSLIGGCVLPNSHLGWSLRVHLHFFNPAWQLRIVQTPFLSQRDGVVRQLRDAASFLTDLVYKKHSLLGTTGDQTGGIVDGASF